MNIPYLINYQPYQPPTGKQLITSINDMVIINCSLPRMLEYFIGLEDVYNTSATFTNTTLNATLEITIHFNKLVTIVNNDETNSPFTVMLRPQQQLQIPIRLNKTQLDASANYDMVNGYVNIEVKNLSNETPVFKNA